MLVLNAATLEQPFANGQSTYTLQSDDLVFTNYDYPVANGGQEWSCIGGDGSGHYAINLRVSGIKYDGEPVNDATFRVRVYVYGREFSGGNNGAGGYDDLILPTAARAALENAPEVADAPVFTWIGEGEKPILCDYNTDNFYISWPAGADASAVWSDDVTVTMRSAYGDELTLEAGWDYKVYASADTTQISVNYVYWPFAPVYTTIEVAVDTRNVVGEVPDVVSSEYDIASVYVHQVQMGGGMAADGTVECYAFYGIDDIAGLDAVFTAPSYMWVAYDEAFGEETTRAAVLGMFFNANCFLKENEDGTFSVVTDPQEATVYDGSGEDGYMPRLIEHTAFLTRRAGEKVVEVDGRPITFTMAFTGGSDKVPSAEDVTVAPGYILGDRLDTHQRWAWLFINHSGWKDANGVAGK